MWGVLSDERMGMSFARVTALISLLSVCTIYILHVIKCMYNIYKGSVSPGSIQHIMPFTLNAIHFFEPMNYSGHFVP
jgi:hypothetical protein